jgi:hypothetical protein
MEFMCKFDTFTFTKASSILIYYRHVADVLGQANIDIPGDALDFQIGGVYWADINGVSPKASIRVFREFQFC